MNIGVIKQVIACFGKSFSGILDDIDLAGSPERSLNRWAVETHDGIFVLERIGAEQRERRQWIGTHLRKFADRGLPVIPYCVQAGTVDKYYVKCEGMYWQLAAYQEGIALERPAYVFDGWRIKPISDFLVRLRDLSCHLQPRGAKGFSLATYIETLCAQISECHPLVADRLLSVQAFLDERFLPNHDLLPIAFAHGDYHPVNIIWGSDCLNTVIDWEFCGLKHELYDLTNMVGCLGVEEPDALVGELVVGIIQRLQEYKYMSDVSWSVFVDYLVALRFAWLSEWLRRDDGAMIDLELTYMKIIINNRLELMAAWGIG